MDELVECLRRLLASNVAFAYKAKGYHWNVMGPNFPQFHEFYGNLYEDLDEAVDPIAENIRKCGALVAPTVQEIVAPSIVGSLDPGTDPIKMAEDALAANQAVVDCLYEAFDAAEDVNLEGLMNFLADRIDTHSKHAWMLSSIVGRQV